MPGIFGTVRALKRNPSDCSEFSHVWTLQAQETRTFRLFGFQTSFSPSMASGFSSVCREKRMTTCDSLCRIFRWISWLAWLELGRLRAQATVCGSTNLVKGVLDLRLASHCSANMSRSHFCRNWQLACRTIGWFGIFWHSVSSIRDICMYESL